MDISQILIYFPAFLLSGVIHEVAHGATAYRFGDPTAKEAGRLTLNPIVHLDLMMSLIVPVMVFISSGMMFGGMKPVPFNPMRFHRGTNIKRAIMWVAAAGPISNFILAFLFLLASAQLRSMIGPEFSYSITNKFFTAMFQVNILLGTFNLLPIPPLDGAKVLAGILPDRMAMKLYQLERFAIIFFIIIIATPIVSVIRVPMELIATGMAKAVGILVGGP